MAGLWVADIYSVQKDSNLVERSPTNTYVRLYSHVTALSDINAGGLL